MTKKHCITTSIIFFFFFLPFKTADLYSAVKWKVIKSVNFNLSYPEGMESAAIAAFSMAESSYVNAADFLKHETSAPIDLLLFSSFENIDEKNARAFYPQRPFLFKKRIYVRFNGSYSDLRKEIACKISLNFISDYLSFDIDGNENRFFYKDIPLFAAYGISRYISTGFGEDADIFMRRSFFSKRIPSLRRLVSAGFIPDESLAGFGQSFFYFIDKKYGRGTCSEILKDMKDISDYEHIFKIHTGKNIDELDQEWRLFFAERFSDGTADVTVGSWPGGTVANKVFFEDASISPDRKKIVYSEKGFNVKTFYIVPVENTNNPKKILTTGSQVSSVGSVNKVVSWSIDSSLFLIPGSDDRVTTLHIYNSADCSLYRKIDLPFGSVSAVSMSADKSRLVFSASLLSGSEIYLYEMKTGSLKRITTGGFSNITPCFSPDGKTVYFSSNRNARGDIFSENYAIFMSDISTGKLSEVVISKGKNIQPSVSPDGKVMAYVSSRTGVYGIYLYNFLNGDSVMIGRASTANFNPSFSASSDLLFFNAFDGDGIAVFEKKMTDVSGDKGSRLYDFYYPQFPENTRLMFGPLFSDYERSMERDRIVAGIAGESSYGITMFSMFSFSDAAGRQKLTAAGNYIMHNPSGDYNLFMEFRSRISMLELSAALFREKSTFYPLHHSWNNDALFYAGFVSSYRDYYGFEASAKYNFSGNYAVAFRGIAARYQLNHNWFDVSSDTFSNRTGLSAAISYENVIYSGFPVDGRMWRIAFEKSGRYAGSDFSYSRADAEFYEYLQTGSMVRFSFHGAAGAVYGSDSLLFKYYTGGYNSVRGHRFMEAAGSRMFLVNTEICFDFIRGLKSGWPYSSGISRLGIAFFADAGSAWDGKYNLMDNSGRFDDLKTGAGAGLRGHLYPGIILKLDCAWPFYRKDFGKKDITFSLGYDF